MVENNTRDLRAVCERLAVFFGKDAVIRFESIEQYVYHGKEENVFTLFAGLVRRDFELSLEILDKLLLSREEDAVRILSGVSWQLNNLIQFFDLLDRGVSREQAFQKLAVKSKRQQKLYGDACANFKLEHSPPLRGRRRPLRRPVPGAQPERPPDPARAPSSTISSSFVRS